ncbi:MAG: hypothetical protein ACPG4X_14790 [Pikeienuella sp.]
MNRIYVASSWRNQYQETVVDLLKMDGHDVYDFKNPPHGDGGFHWSAIDPDWQNWTPEVYREHLMRSPIAAHGFNADFRAMHWCDTCVLVMPCGRSAHLELGWCAGAGKRTMILLENGEPELMYLIADDIVTSMDEMRRVLGKSEARVA